MKRGTPNSFSSFLMVELREGWEICKAAAVFETCSVRASIKKYFSCSNSIKTSKR